MRVAAAPWVNHVLDGLHDDGGSVVYLPRSPDESFHLPGLPEVELDAPAPLLPGFVLELHLVLEAVLSLGLGENELRENCLDDGSKLVVLGHGVVHGREDADREYILASLHPLDENVHDPVVHELLGQEAQVLLAPLLDEELEVVEKVDVLLAGLVLTV